MLSQMKVSILVNMITHLISVTTAMRVTPAPHVYFPYYVSLIYYDGFSIRSNRSRNRGIDGSVGLITPPMAGWLGWPERTLAYNALGSTLAGLYIFTY